MVRGREVEADAQRRMLVLTATHALRCKFGLPRPMVLDILRAGYPQLGYIIEEQLAEPDLGDAVLGSALDGQDEFIDNLISNG